MVAARHTVYPLQRIVLLSSIMACMTAAIWPKVPVPDWTPIEVTMPVLPPDPGAADAASSMSVGLQAPQRLATSPGA